MTREDNQPEAAFVLPSDQAGFGHARGADRSYPEQEFYGRNALRKFFRQPLRGKGIKTATRTNREYFKLVREERASVDRR